ncbi:MAG TPA: hypothetical protein VMG99_09120 [Thermoplasmata archaeon]|nr:hypothetical protein [Thermoplasmata archaeon]
MGNLSTWGPLLGAIAVTLAVAAAASADVQQQQSIAAEETSLDCPWNPYQYWPQERSVLRVCSV